MTSISPSDLTNPAISNRDEPRRREKRVFAPNSVRNDPDRWRCVGARSARQTAPTIPFDSVPDFLKLPPDVYLGQAAGVAVNSKGHVFVFSCGGTSGPAYGAAAQLLEFDADGKFVREIGRNVYAWSFAHAVRIDKEDNILAVDKARTW